MKSGDVVRLILAHLVAAGCGSPPAERAEPSVPAPVAAPPAPSAAPAASAPPAASPPSSCRVGTNDCGTGFVCAERTDGSRMLPGPGNCWPAGKPIPGGRPLFVEGEARVAQTRGADAAGDARLLRAAIDEHASIAAFARTICQLLALGAPAALVAKTGRALVDEIEHARLAFEALGGNVEAEALPEAVAPIAGAGSDLVEALLVDTFRGGCIGETLAAHEAAVLGEHATEPRVRDFYRKVGADEARHAALAYETVLWLVQAHPGARTILAREQERFAAEAPPEHQLLLAPLLAVIASADMR